MKKKKAKSVPTDHVRRFLAIIEAVRSDAFPNKLVLAEDLNCTPRTVQRYTTLLRELGAPLEFDRDQNGFYFSKEWYL